MMSNIFKKLEANVRGFSPKTRTLEGAPELGSPPSAGAGRWADFQAEARTTQLFSFLAVEIPPTVDEAASFGSRRYPVLQDH